MDEMTTYTRRENARRAGVAAGVPSERIKITVHKENGEVRFGWKEKETSSGDMGPLQPQHGAPATHAASTPETRPTRRRSESSTPKRPKAGGKCAAIWDYLDEHPTTTAKEVREAAAEHGWNVNNAVCELYAWRKASTYR
ncbi:hypothetical protein SAMN05880590_10712 [Rhizobium sp. RU35A]|uniref:hypothetical protein n=1 Tax=Rhizobium sp. RU35A TaxID=1907414 RepID=UPI0009566EA9|nr:hypothetical protein [Rhizobium sp. RU35A]SIQ75388.1 hypothetical protein SAMN05880590_10712 [Rhizobium sp. RU35A]